MTAGEPLLRPRAVLFDWDNTLVDTWSVIHQALNATFVVMDHPQWTLEQTRTRVGRSLRETFPAMFGERWRRAQEVFYEEYESIHLINLESLPGAAELVEALDSRGVYLGVVSNKSGANLRREAGHLGWERFFGALVGATDAARDKPAPEPVEMALGPSGVAPGPEVWFVGDTAIDMECAHATGCVPVLVRAEAPEAREFEAHAPRRHFRDCAELASLVRGL